MYNLTILSLFYYYSINSNNNCRYCSYNNIKNRFRDTSNMRTKNFSSLLQTGFELKEKKIVFLFVLIL